MLRSFWKMESPLPMGLKWFYQVTFSIFYSNPQQGEVVLAQKGLKDKKDKSSKSNSRLQRINQIKSYFIATFVSEKLI